MFYIQGRYIFKMVTGEYSKLKRFTFIPYDDIEGLMAEVGSIFNCPLKFRIWRGHMCIYRYVLAELLYYI